MFAGSYTKFLYGFHFGLDHPNEDGSNPDDLVKKYEFKPYFVVSAHTEPIRTLACSHEKGYLVTGSSDETIRIYNLRKNREHGVLTNQKGMNTIIVWSH